MPGLSRRFASKVPFKREVGKGITAKLTFGVEDERHAEVGRHRRARMGSRGVSRELVEDGGGGRGISVV